MATFLFKSGSLFEAFDPPNDHSLPKVGAVGLGGGCRIFPLSYHTPRYLEGHPERDTRPGLRSLRTAREIQVYTLNYS